MYQHLAENPLPLADCGRLPLLPPLPGVMHRLALLLPVTLLIGAGLLSRPASGAERPNILMIAIDDQNDWIGSLGGHPQVKTPHLDALAARGTNFLNAHCQAPLCNPSRTSLLTGLRPSTTGIYGLQPGLRQVEDLKQHVTLPQELMKAGYYTYTCGKIYHDGAIKPKAREGEFSEHGPAPGMPRPASPLARLPITGRHPAMDWGVFPEKDEDQADWKIADAAITKLRNLPKGQPWFVAAGFRLPHVPCFASQQWFDLYPAHEVTLPPVKEDDREDLPRFAGYMNWKLPEPRLKTLRQFDEWRPLVRAYLATISFMDSQVGRVLEALKASGQMDNTIVVVWGDHGWHLGEKGITGKNTLWERSTRVPLIWSGPGITTGQRCNRPAELLDIFPTLLELAGLPPRNDLEGHSLKPQLQDATAPREFPAITTHNQNNHAIRTEKWRYIRYADGSEELYDMEKDPNEWHNLASAPDSAAIKAELAKWLPQRNAPPAPGSASRVLTFTQGQAVWEDEPIAPDAPFPDDPVAEPR